MHRWQARCILCRTHDRDRRRPSRRTCWNRSGAGGALEESFVLPPFAGMPVRWTPDGRSVAYVSRQGNAENIWLQPVNGGKPKQVTHFSDGRIWNFRVVARRQASRSGSRQRDKRRCIVYERPLASHHPPQTGPEQHNQSDCQGVELDPADKWPEQDVQGEEVEREPLSNHFEMNECRIPGRRIWQRTGQGNDDDAAFQKILDHCSIVRNCWTGAVAHLGIARANALQSRTSQGADADAARAILADLVVRYRERPRELCDSAAIAKIAPQQERDGGTAGCRQ